MIAQYTALPNLHPALVHFPIALLPVAWGFDLAALLRRRRWLDLTATWLYALAALSAWASAEAGEQAADSLASVPPRVQPYIATHSDWGHYTLYALAALALVRILLAWRDRGGEGLSLPPARWLVVVAGLAAVGLVLRTADLGGGLVYEHGLGVAAGSAEPPSEPTAGGDAAAPDDGEVEDSGQEAASLHRGTDGSLSWRPAGRPSAALAALDRVDGSAGIRLADPETGEAQGGVAVQVDGRTLLVLPGSFGSVQVDAGLELVGFTGSVGVVHNVAGVGDAGAFTVASSGGAKLARLEGGQEKVLDRSDSTLPDGPFTLSVSVAGRHLKGMLDGRTLTHGHISPAADGATGVLLDGHGTVRLVAIQVTPLS